MEIIALSGYARAGKDVAASVLVERFGFKQVAFADKLREVLYALNPIVSFSGWSIKDHDTGLWHRVDSGPETYVTVQNVIDNYGWDNYKGTEYGPEIRRLLQRLGTEAGRQTMWDSIWVDAALTGVSVHDRVVVTDVRFPNEAHEIRKRGGIMVRVNREGNGPAVDSEGHVHKSETALDNYKFDYVLNNNFKTVEEYHDWVRAFYDQVGEDQYFKHVIGD